MASLVSMTFSIPLSAAFTFANEVALRKPALVGVSRTASKPSASCNTTGVLSSLNRSCQRLVTTPSGPLCEILYCHLNVDSCSHNIIYGYWVGPDIDDGFGFVEAFVNQITCKL